MLSFEEAPSRSIVSLQNWLNGNSCIARAETAYLSQSRDLLCLATAKDGAIDKLIDWVEDFLIGLSRFLPMVKNSRLSQI